MAVGKNKKSGKGKKGQKKKASDPFTKKEWYDVRAPPFFPTKSIGKTMATKTQGTKIARDTLMGRIFEVSLGDLKPHSEDEAFRKFKLKVEDVQGYNCLTQFQGLDITTDKLRSLVRKKQTLIEAYLDVRTTDGYALRLFAICFTKRHPKQHRKTSYAQSAQVRAIRKKMVEIMHREASVVDLQGLVEKLVTEAIGKEIEKHAGAIYPLQNCHVRKVKMLRTPKLDINKLVEAHGGLESLASSSSSEVGKRVVVVKETVSTKAKKGGKKDKKDDAKEKEAEADEEEDKWSVNVKCFLSLLVCLQWIIWEWGVGYTEIGRYVFCVW